jgi:hypothetical protein
MHFGIAMSETPIGDGDREIARTEVRDIEDRETPKPR